MLLANLLSIVFSNAAVRACRHFKSTTIFLTKEWKPSGFGIKALMHCKMFRVSQLIAQQRPLSYNAMSSDSRLATDEATDCIQTTDF
jgi:hypothetical protein